MDVNLWASRVHSAKHPVCAARLFSDNTFSLDDAGGDYDDARCWFPCPFCYVGIEVTKLSIHLQEEHCFDLKNAVCPLCAENLGKDVTGHFMVQHVSSLKQRRKCNRSSFWTGSSFINGRENTCESSLDPLLSPFICGLPFKEHEDFQQYESSNINIPVPSDVERFKTPVHIWNFTTRALDYAELSSHCQEDNEERRKRVAFVQELIASTIF